MARLGRSPLSASTPRNAAGGVAIPELRGARVPRVPGIAVAGAGAAG